MRVFCAISSAEQPSFLPKGIFTSARYFSYEHFFSSSVFIEKVVFSCYLNRFIT